MVLGDAFFVGRQQLFVEAIELLLHEQLGLVGLTAEAVVLDLHC